MQLIELFAQRHPELRFQLFALSSENILEASAATSWTLACRTSTASTANISKASNSPLPAWACCTTAGTSRSTVRA